MVTGWYNYYCCIQNINNKAHIIFRFIKSKMFNVEWFFFHLPIKENAMNVEIFQKLIIMKKFKEKWIN